MRYTQFKAFENHLESAAPSHFAKLYTLLCKEMGERLFAFDGLKASFLRHGGKIDIRTYSSDPKGERDFLRDLDSPSLFCQRQLFHMGETEKLSKDFFSRFEKGFRQLGSQITIAFSAESIHRGSAFYKFLEKEGVILDIGGEKPWEKEKALQEWLLSRAEKEGKTISKEALQLLVKGCGGSFAVLFSEWEKLSLFTLRRSQVSKQDVEQISILLPEESSWQVGEALLQGNPEKALKAIQDVLYLGQAPIALLRQIRHQFTTALYILSCEESGKRDLIFVKYPYLKGHFLEKQLALASQFGIKRLQKGVIALERMEYQAKDKMDDPNLLFTYLTGLIT